MAASRPDTKSNYRWYQHTELTCFRGMYALKSHLPAQPMLEHALFLAYGIRPQTYMHMSMHSLAAQIIALVMGLLPNGNAVDPMACMRLWQSWACFQCQLAASIRHQHDQSVWWNGKLQVNRSWLHRALLRL